MTFSNRVHHIFNRGASVTTSLVLLIAAFNAAHCQAGEHSRYFPERGRQALFQRRLDLKTPTLVMVLAGEPGEEDLATMTTLRMETGARVVAVYLTNGGGTASDDKDEIPTVVAGRRKEEAYRATSLIGCKSFFLNCPEVPLGAEGRKLDEIWQQDSVGERLAAAIDRFKPDVLLIPQGLRASDSARTILLRESMAVVGLSGGPSTVQGSVRSAWRIPRIFLEVDSAGGGAPVSSNRLHPYWRKTFLSIAREAWQAYASLRLTLQDRSLQPVHWYRQISPSRTAGVTSLLEGEPRLTADLAWVNSAISLGIDLARKNEKQNALTAIAEALARIEKLMVTKGDRLGDLEQRVLVGWKDGLEDYRCSLDDVSADIQPSDSIMAGHQLFFLRVKSVHLPVAAKDAEIDFPAARDSTWVINESGKYHFPLSAPTEFRVLTPEKMQLSYPPSLYGLARAEMRTSFPYYLVHRDKDRARNFAYRGEVRLKIGPARAFEVLTPVVRMAAGEDLEFALYNITRQPMKSDAWVKDSVIADSRTEVFLQRKDHVTLNRIRLLWADRSISGDHVAEVHIGSVTVGRFLVRSFNVRVDSSKVTGIISAASGNILETSLRRLNVPWVNLDSAALHRNGWDTCSVIVIDRNALALRTDIRDVEARLQRWVRGGGHLIIFPQHGRLTTEAEIFQYFRFLADRTAPNDTIQVPDTRMALLPNALGSDDWQGWLVSRATDRIIPAQGVMVEPVAFSKGSSALCILRSPYGSGNVTAVSLDLNHQLQTIHTGACRILANLLSN